MLYFAYGANLCRTHMALWCPESKPVAGAVLPDHRLVFRFWADILPSSGHEVHGGVYEVSPRDLVSLDEYEDCPELYDRRTIVVMTPSGAAEAIAYQMRVAYNFAPPAEDYWHLVRKGYEDWGLDSAALPAVRA
jgi:gamma-glutamylcyclotransferase (GGCT)/AIG2-like uncharacterized protein YtfP